jgi:hypothetical protein
VLAELFKKAASGGLAGLISKGSKFGGLDIKRVYFGYVDLAPFGDLILRKLRLLIVPVT